MLSVAHPLGEHGNLPQDTVRLPCRGSEVLRDGGSRMSNGVDGDEGNKMSEERIRSVRCRRHRRRWQRPVQLVQVDQKAAS